MPDIFAEILGRALAEKITGKKEKEKTQIVDKEDIFFESVRDQAEYLQIMNLEDKNVQLLAIPKNHKDEKRVFHLAYHLLRVVEQEPGKKEDLLPKIIMCTNNLLEANNKSSNYWTLYGKVNELAQNDQEAKKGYDTAQKYIK